MDIFEYQRQKAAGESAPLAERMRPRTLSEFVGQTHLTGPESLLRIALENDRLFSMILWGPPGSGKTTLARIFARETRSHFIHFSAVLSGVKDIRTAIETAKEQQTYRRKKTILFVDEIHRFSKSQQDAFLHHVESGLITLVGATTENPSFEVIPPLLSRCRVMTLNALGDDDMSAALHRALSDAEKGLGGRNVSLSPEAMAHLIRASEGDARTALNNLEIAAGLAGARAKASPPVITLADMENALQRKALRHDKSGDAHYNLISAFHKSMRGSDPDAAVYWLRRMLDAGEDPFFIARRMVRFASEDVGNADPHALYVSLSAMEAFRFLGPPEGELALAQAALYLATAPKSNSVYVAAGEADDAVREHGGLPVPLHIRNAPTGLMKGLGYGRGYRYAHDDPDGCIPQEHLPEILHERRFYRPSGRGYEKIIRQRMENWARLKQKKSEDA